MRYAIILVSLVLSFIFALPNLFPDQPVLISSGSNSISSISKALSEKNIAFEIGQSGHIYFKSVDDQMLARDVIIMHTQDPNAVALNLEKRTPKWLGKIGAHAMKLGLDLQGGIHFLLEVDTSHIEKSHGESQSLRIKELLKSQRIRFTAIQENTHDTTIDLLSSADSDNAAALLINSIPDIKVSTNGSELTLSQHSSVQDARAYAVSQTIVSLEKRINELGISEATIQQQGDRYISIDLPGVQDIVYAKNIIGKTATLRFQMVDPNNQSPTLETTDGSALSLEPKVVLSGDSISYAHAKLNDGLPVVEIRLDGQADAFYAATTKYVGKRLAVIYSETKNNETLEHIISAPVIRQPLGDNFIIQGSASYTEAKDLALLLRSGALAAPVKFVEETTIGPSLGSDNITKGIISLLAGSSVIFLFMAYYYRTLGIMANAALCLNVIMILAILSIMGATLTLPGIAGIVLSVGMAVDANVLINERIREETIAGNSLRQAVTQGYEKALSAIIDANITTLLVTLVLFGLGSGAVKGFAITTCMGILSSIFTSVYFTQTMTELFIEKGWIRQVNMKKDWFVNIPKINFMKLSKKAFTFSIILLLSCLIILPFKGINLGLDFTGGHQITLKTDQYSAEGIREALKSINILQPQVQTYGTSDTFMIKIGQTDSATANELTHLVSSALPGSTVLQSEFIGPQIGSSMLKSSLFAVAVALAATLAYVAIRFEYRFAISAVISLIHDPILILGIFSLTQIEFNLIALAAMLTILGYSINDTIVVYDRVRENFQKSLKLNTTEVINDAINQTLSRTVLTSCLTLTVVASLYLFGGDYLHGFSLALLIGIIIGTYSSIYIAGSLALKLGLKRQDLIPTPEPTGEIYES